MAQQVSKEQSAVEIIRRHDALDGARGAWKAHWQEIADYIIPRKATVNRTPSPGGKRTERQFDGTAADAVDELVATLFNNMTNPAQQWFGLRPIGGPGGLDEQVPVRRWLDQSVETMTATLGQSNFYQQILEALVDLATMGTAGIFSEEQPWRLTAGPGGAPAGSFRGFNFRTLPIAEYVIDVDNQGLVDSVYRKFELTARQAVQRWGDDAGKSVNEAFADETKRHQPFQFIHGLAPRDDRAWPQSPTDKRATAMPVASTYVAVRDRHIIGESGYRELPVHVARWSLSSGEIYGRSPAMKALPFVKVLNTMVRYGLEALPRALYPPMLVKEGTVIGGTLRLSAGAVNHFDGSVDERPGELVTQARFDVEHAKEDIYRQRIEQAFGVDQMRLRDDRQMTAEEVIERRHRRFQALAPMTGRIERELLKPLVERCWMMLLGGGAFGDPPRELGAADSLLVTFEGPLARAQQRHGIDAGMDTFRTLAPLAQIYPGLADHFDADGYARDVAKALGSARYLLSAEDVKQTRQARAKAQAAAMLQAAP
ncbi:MAG: portal protein [Proteobacteria bacterium]|nr:portal protein [Pseudomonadota bacterium]